MLAKVLDQAHLCLTKGVTVFTDFIDPQKTKAAIAILNKADKLGYLVFGGMQDCERCIIGIYPESEHIGCEAFPISIIKLSNRARGNYAGELAHRNVLGSILGMGIERSKVGDINIADNVAYVFVNSEIAEYIDANIDSVGNIKVNSEIIATDGQNLPKPNTHEERIIVTSLRADCIISAAFKLSRSKAQSLINAERLQVNWSVVTSNSRDIKENDIITLRGFGRIKYLETVSATKKDKLVILIQRYYS